jgi:hypothetical protein
MTLLQSPFDASLRLLMKMFIWNFGQQFFTTWSAGRKRLQLTIKTFMLVD